MPGTLEERARVVKAAVPRASADINVTPLIDVLLVLLVIFLAALPLSQKGMDVNLPQAGGPDGPPPDVIVVEYGADHRLSINRQDLALGDLEARLRGIYDQRRDKTLYIIGAPTLRYADVVDVIDAARGAGVNRVGIVTEELRRGVGPGAPNRH